MVDHLSLQPQLKLLTQHCYKEFGWVTIPLLGKTPQFKDWQNLSHPDNIPEEVFNISNNLGLVCGSVSKIFVLDINNTTDFDTNKQENGASKRTGMEEWGLYVLKHGEPKTLKSRTGGGGIHYFFKYSDRIAGLFNADRIANNDEGKTITWSIITNKGQVVLPPSIHPDTGIKYEWDSRDHKIGYMPEHLLNLILSSPIYKDLVIK